MASPRILILDIETTPILGYAYRNYDTDLVSIVEDWYVYAWSAKWYGSKEVFFEGVYEDKSDKRIMKKLYDLIKQADVLMGHNIDRFDVKKIKTRFAYHGFPPLPPKPTIDTLKILRKEFSISSNTLDYACKFFGLPRKKPSDQKDWLVKMKAGDEKVWRKIKLYSVQDSVIVEPLYDRIKASARTHPNIAVITDTPNGCPTCGSTNLMREGTDYTSTGRVQQWRCKDCGRWSRGKYTKVTNIR